VRRSDVSGFDGPTCALLSQLGLAMEEGWPPLRAEGLRPRGELKAAQSAPANGVRRGRRINGHRYIARRLSTRGPAPGCPQRCPPWKIHESNLFLRSRRLARCRSWCQCLLVGRGRFCRWRRSPGDRGAGGDCGVEQRRRKRWWHRWSESGERRRVRD